MKSDMTEFEKKSKEYWLRCVETKSPLTDDWIINHPEFEIAFRGTFEEAVHYLLQNGISVLPAKFWLDVTNRERVVTAMASYYKLRDLETVSTSVISGATVFGTYQYNKAK